MSFIIVSGLLGTCGAAGRGQGRLPGPSLSSLDGSEPFVGVHGSLGPLACHLLRSETADPRHEVAGRAELDPASLTLVGRAPAPGVLLGTFQEVSVVGSVLYANEQYGPAGWQDLRTHWMVKSSSLWGPACGSTVSAVATEHTSSIALRTLTGGWA